MVHRGSSGRFQDPRGGSACAAFQVGLGEAGGAGSFDQLLRPWWGAGADPHLLGARVVSDGLLEDLSGHWVLGEVRLVMEAAVTVDGRVRRPGGGTHRGVVEKLEGEALSPALGAA